MRRSSRSTAGVCCGASRRLERDIKELGATRATQRKARLRRSIPTVALVGYTNAGKSTVLNRLTDAGVLVENQLFSTLDPTTRRLRLPGGETVLLSDTVGFVRRLPHQLVDAFRSTLEEVVEADLLLHVVDLSAPDTEGRIAAVETVLREIEAGDVPVLLVWNKADLVESEVVETHLRRHDSVAISAATGDGVDELLAAIGDRLRALRGHHRVPRPLRPGRRPRRAPPDRRGLGGGTRRRRHTRAGPPVGPRGRPIRRVHEDAAV